MSDHTPGPWTRVTEHPIIPGKIRAGVHCTLAEVSGLGPQACANAHLMAAAPDMLEALKQAREWILEYRTAGRSDTTLQLINAAIAKAEGQEEA